MHCIDALRLASSVYSSFISNSTSCLTVRLSVLGLGFNSRAGPMPRISSSNSSGVRTAMRPLSISSIQDSRALSRRSRATSRSYCFQMCWGMTVTSDSLYLSVLVAPDDECSEADSCIELPSYLPSVRAIRGDEALSVFCTANRLARIHFSTSRSTPQAIPSLESCHGPGARGAITFVGSSRMLRGMAESGSRPRCQRSLSGVMLVKKTPSKT
ncbi:hypothetical protein D3C74_346990 [compost metagenome]